MIEFAEITIGFGSVLSCTQCEPAADPEFFDGARIIESVRTACSVPRANVAFVGPEPFNHPELPLFVSAAVAAGAARIRLRTDGGALSEPANAHGVVQAGVTHLEVVVLAGDPAVHDELTGSRGLFAACMSGIAGFGAAAAQAGAHVAMTGAVPVCRHNLDHLAGAVAALASAGAVSVALEVDVEGGVSSKFSAALATAIETGTVNGVWVHVVGLRDGDVPVSRLHGIAPATVIEVGA